MQFVGELAEQVERVGLADVLAPDGGDALAQVRLGALHMRDVLAGFERRHLVDLLLQQGGQGRWRRRGAGDGLGGGRGRAPGQDGAGKQQAGKAHGGHRCGEKTSR